MIHQGRSRSFEGRRVSLALVDGSYIDDCELVSVGRPAAPTLWICVDETDAFIAAADVVDVWLTESHVDGSHKKAAA